MKLKSMRAARRLIALAALVALAAGPGCDWLKSSGPGARSSPFLSVLNIERSAGVFCGPNNDFQISFRYDDPQDDIFQATLKFTHVESQTIRQEIIPWTAFDLASSAGRAITRFFFVCGAPSGRWTVAVSVEDVAGHKSNVLMGEVELNSR